MPNYAHGKVYKLVNNVNDAVYIGSTCQRLCARMAAHRSRAKLVNSGELYPNMMSIGVEKFHIVLVEKWPCGSKAELENRESEHIHKLTRTGIPLYNLIVDGKQSQQSVEKMSRSQTGRRHSSKTKKKLSDSKMGSLNPSFKRGCAYFDRARNLWEFVWREQGKRKKRKFSVSAHGARGARKLAEAMRDQIYPEA